MIKTPGLYDLINTIVSAAVYVAVFIFFLFRKKLSCAPLRIGYEKTEALRQKNGFLKVLFSKGSWLVLTSAVYVGIYVLYGLAPDFKFLSNNEYFTLNNYFTSLYFGSIIVMAALLVTGNDFREGMDLITPFLSLEMGLGKIACFCAGCCYGIEWKNGAYNHTTGRMEFPVQILECFVGVLIAGILFFYLVKRKTTGKCYPLYMILYSATRFCTEFLRGDHLSNWVGLKPFQVLCLIAIAIGVGWIVLINILNKHNKRFLLDTNLIDYLISKGKK